ncbi:uncharacterized protein N7483_003399 [Penicillium malachiteum]|uniref:uncharacterized protein n=1 Tax=Penicillium malachiteum TaxID=1324776 RepID=UPI002547E84F|nr:uncharacterized protein N7483_003399 [Penicillium malachiteum]KAJ5728891.1 hypothetical protein N7483_003399 [Penicillium malachiteum]
MVNLGMDFDDIALEAIDSRRQELVKLASGSGLKIAELANRYRQRDDGMLVSMHCGSFNFSFRVNWDDGGEDWLIRFPLPGKSMFLDEKVRREAWLMQYLAKETTIPVPRVIAYGMGDKNPTGLGPFILMTWIDGKNMADLIKSKDRPDNIGEDSVAGKPVVDGRPLTREMNELIRTCGLNDCMPERTYQTSVDYIGSLLDLQSTHLEQQQNSVYSSRDCREKYACRQLMKAIALNFIPPSDCGPFKLFCDDLRPGNILVDDSLRIVGVIDWEFSYAAPSQFAGSIPWWLILERPHRIANQRGAEAFFQEFLPKATLFLEALEAREETHGLTEHNSRLSVRMHQSIENKSAWFALALHALSTVDLIYWDLLDEYCWGPRSSIAERVHRVTTTPEIYKAREDFVQSKIKQLQEYYKELGVDLSVSYEAEEPLQSIPEVKGDPAPQV